MLAVLLTIVQLFLPDPDRMVLSLCCLTIVPIAAGTKWVRMGFEHARTIGVSRVPGESLGLAIVIGIMMLSAQQWVPPMAQIASETLVAVYLMLILFRRGYRPRLTWKPAVALPVFKSSLPLLGHLLLGLFIYNSALSFLQNFRDSEQAGYYAAAYTMISLLPTISRYGIGSASEQALYQTALVHVACRLPSVAALLAGGIIGLAFRDSHAVSTHALQILIWAIAMTAVVNVILNLTLIPRYGMIGAAVSTERGKV